MNAIPSRSPDSFRTFGKLVLLGSLSFALFCGCYEQPAPQQAPEAVPVRLATVQKQDVQKYAYFTGKTQVDPITIVPRIRGYLEEICFQSGDIVNEGDILFKIESFDYQNRVDQAKAQISIAQANEAKAQADYDREMTLSQRGEGFTTQADIDKTKALLADATARITLQQSILEEAEKQLERTIIKSPVRGKTSRNLIEVGNLVDGTTGNPPELATLMSMDPMYVYFQVTDSDFRLIQKQYLAAIKEKLGAKYEGTDFFEKNTITEISKKEGLNEIIPFEVQLLGDATSAGNENLFPFKGVLDYHDNYIDVNTGTNTVRGKISNANFILFPGNLCRIKLAEAPIHDAIVIEDKAVMRDLNDKYIWIVDDKGVAQRKTIQVGALLEDGRSRLVTSGLAGGESYVLDGIQKVRAGVAVKDMPVK